MEKTSILFILLPFPSHYFASFPYAKSLLKKGENIVFTGSHDQRLIVENEGFLFREISYFSEYSITSFKLFIALLLQSLLDKTALTKRYKEWVKCVQTIDQVLQTTNPSSVYIDDHLWHYYPIIIKRCKNVEIINTKLSTKKSIGVPPLDSSFIPKPGIFSMIICEILWVNHLISLGLRDILVKIALLNRDEDYFIERFAGKIGLDLRILINSKNCFYKSLNHVNVLILAPSVFEFPNKALKSNECYIDMPMERDERSLCTVEFLILFDTLQKLRTNENKIIYCSFGTLSGVNAKKVIPFIKSFFSIFKEEKNWYLIFSTGGIKFENIPDNVFLINQVPQLKLLRICDLMITHGGLTSIKECIQRRVPMLVYPLNEKADQKGNAARVCFHNLGARGNISTDSFEAIRNKIKTTLK